jgi:uncharacterized membrane protein YfhO
MPNAVIINPALTKLGVFQVFHDSLATIYQLPHTRNFFSTSTSSCSVVSTNVDMATVHCSKPASLLRTELSMKGWKATVNGKAVPITTINGVYQRINVPEGTSTIEYSFFPPHERAAVFLALLAGLFLVGSLVNERRRFIPKRRAKDY